MKTLTLPTLLLALPLLSVASTIDPIGDTYGTGMPFDIKSVSAVSKGGFTTFEILFADPVPADLDAHLWGAIEIDVDRNAATGKTSELDFPNMNFNHGVDYVIAYYYDDDPGTAVILDVTNDDFFYLPAEYGSNYFRITVPVAGRMHYAVGVGDGQNLFSGYSDIAGNGYQLLVSETPEPGTWAMCAAAFAFAGLTRLRRKARSRARF